MPTRENRAVFLDRDGTLNMVIPGKTPTGKDFFRCPLVPDEVELCPGVPEGLAMIKERGYLLVVVTNQGRLQSGELTREGLVAINGRLDDLLVKAGVPTIDAWYWCPHKSRKAGRQCTCGKPRPGMINTACRDLRIDHAKSLMIGDDPRDMAAGRAAKLWKNLMVESDRFEDTPDADLVFKNFADAARAVWLLEGAR